MMLLMMKTILIEHFPQWATNKFSWILCYEIPKHVIRANQKMLYFQSLTPGFLQRNTLALLCS